MKVFKLILSEKREEFIFNKAYEKFIKAKNRKSAYKKALEIAKVHFKRFKDAPIPIIDKESILWFGENTAVWINSIEEIEII